VAVKEFRYAPDRPPPVAALRSFVRELGTLQRVSSHPNLVQLVGAILRPGISIVYEYMHHGALYHLLSRFPQRRGPAGAEPSQLALWERLCLAADVARGLAHLHAHNILHRDCKSHNILLDQFRGRLRAKLCDFGSVKVLEAAAAQQERFTEVGTAGYTAPEVFGAIDGVEGYAFPADVFSLGVVLWELVALDHTAHPLLGLPPVRYCRELERGTRPPIPDDEALCPHEFARIIQACWAYDPRERPSALAVLRDLERLAQRYAPADLVHV
jgi:serine/threonine protein kinase